MAREGKRVVRELNKNLGSDWLYGFCRQGGASNQ
jgi:hypothetical protein